MVNAPLQAEVHNGNERMSIVGAMNELDMSLSYTWWASFLLVDSRVSRVLHVPKQLVTHLLPVI